MPTVKELALGIDPNGEWDFFYMADSPASALYYAGPSACEPEQERYCEACRRVREDGWPYITESKQEYVIIREDEEAWHTAVEAMLHRMAEEDAE